MAMKLVRTVEVLAGLAAHVPPIHVLTVENVWLHQMITATHACAQRDFPEIPVLQVRTFQIFQTNSYPN